MERSMTYTSDTIAEIEKNYTTFNDQISHMSSDITSTQSNVLRLEKEVLNLERYSRGFNLRFGGIPEDDNENAIEKIQEIIKD